ncbi:hypothetical protein HUU62_01550 [Rhodoferax sp. 4810]|uniref:Uncharacterized protein n=1 Tax=Thiospirillum jenense TaxID=1653858 RepID=A0A839HC95_9GAMM|nr:hypothetical protein [Thiospirillum jenense]MBB1073099.1 hypothetical protein [Rhodoferax jenense]MBB1125046.1 hypothetical protein [Thiospirillum jenense]
MKIFSFSLPIPTIDDALVNALYGRYSDMSIGSHHGQMYVACDREAACLESAIDSAVTDLWAMGIHPLRIELDIPELAA